jgi:hypothetical protein
MLGWFGLRSHVLFALSTVNADRDEAGNYLIFGEPIVVGLDPEEVVVPSGAMYSVAGRRYSVANLLNSTSYGMAVNVV